MKAIKNFNGDTLAEMRKAINEALAKVGNTYGCKLDIGRISYDATTFTTKITACVVGKEECSLSTDEIKWKNNLNRSWIHDLNIDYHGLEIKGDNGKKLTFIGFNTRAKRYPYFFRNVDGSGIKYTESIVKKLHKAYKAKFNTPKTAKNETPTLKFEANEIPDATFIDPTLVKNGELENFGLTISDLGVAIKLQGFKVTLQGANKTQLIFETGAGRKVFGAKRAAKLVIAQR